MILKVCIGSACHVKGSYDVIDMIKKMLKVEKLEDRIELKACFCLNKCLDGVSLSYGGKVVQLDRENAYEEIKAIIEGAKL